MASPKQAIFAREYLIDLNATAAARRAGYKSKGHALEARASKLLKQPAVAALVQAGMDARARRTEMDGDRVLQELARVALFDPADMFDKDGRMLAPRDMPESARRCLSGIEIDRITGAWKFRFWSKVDALALLARHFKICTERVEVKDITDRAERLQKALVRAREQRT